MFTLPNLLSLFRIAAAPFALYAAFFGSSFYFWCLLVAMFISDGLDGWIARRWDMRSALGAKLDSYGDIVTYFTATLGAWWLWPEVLKQERYFIIAAIVIYITPAFVALWKFGQLVSYHTWLTKVSAVLISVGIVLMLAFDQRFVFHLSVVVLLFEAVENIFITTLLKEPKTDVHSLWHVYHNRF